MGKINKIYAIKCLTNLHVGSGQTNFGVVDNLVQRDVNTNLPTIHSSSLKGALREFFSHAWPDTEDPGENGQWKFLPVFGDQNKPGQWQFLSADLVSRPVRSNVSPYFNATSPTVIRKLIEKMNDFRIAVPNELENLAGLEVSQGRPLVFERAFDNAIIEESDWLARSTENSRKLSLSPMILDLLGANLLLMHPDDFQQLEFPVIARNQLDNGESKNLWYEEVVPYDSRFASFIIQSEECRNEFDKALEGFVQIGANASVGYGLCSMYQTLMP
ncbi:CRISPR-associated protein, Cmr4 family [Cyclobacterium xiamenense]|uniref:CRISPR-associated protein, Cmr4 family n=1 Tax=Cyclobacterium xiamenense TaxID=1297121 RepID=A0A1H7BZT6_9BACT|nr:type III-B CRISPR module RAMP protein Cmr4 [Cyclobacterium xiamenense]SEJ81857.1 CRISPR-associated protein, Cmr4 family [Cyclobacterium xiamenense]